MEGITRYRTYWVAWSVLFALTILMLLTEAAPFYRIVAVVLLVVAMLVKASLIVAWFMHLRFERAALVVSVVGATLATAAVLFGLIAADGVSMLRHAAQ